MLPTSPRPQRSPSSGLLLASMMTAAAWAAPVIHEVEIAPMEWSAGSSFSLRASTSTDVTQVVGTVDFRPYAPSLLRVIFTGSPGEWTASGSVPATVPEGFRATLTVFAFNSARERAEVREIIGPILAAFFRDYRG